MDVDTSHALDRLGDRIDHLEVGWRELRGEVGELRGEVGELRGEVGELRGEVGELRGEVGELRSEMVEVRGEVGELRSEMVEVRGDMSGLRDGLQALSHRVDEGRRHADVLYESLRDDIRLVAEGLAVVGAKLDDRRS